MSDTPKTDAARHDLTEYGPPTPCSYGDWVAAEFACKLERERDEAMEKAKQWEKIALRADTERAEAIKQNAKLRDIAERAIEAIPFTEGYGEFSYAAAVLRAELNQLKEGAK